MIFHIVLYIIIYRSLAVSIRVNVDDMSEPLIGDFGHHQFEEK